RDEAPRDPETGRIWNPAEGFAEFRSRYLHTESPWFHIAAIEAMESMPPGSILQILWPPEHGKTRLWEDYYTFLLATDPSMRLTIGSEKLAQSKKIARFVRDRLESTAKGYERLREDWGPFAPMSPKERRELRDLGVDDLAAGQQAWGVEAFDVRKKPKGMEAQRDYSMQALGMGGSIIGTRCDRLGVDDPQGAMTLRKKDSTSQLLETIRQDWLSRPGPTGRTYFLANRVGPGDIHEALQESAIVDKTITLPAWDPAHGGWLWPERYSPADYRRMRKNAGEGAWERNYMQKGLANKDAAFSDKRIGNCKNNLRSILDPPPRPAAGGEARVIIGLDPGLSKASFHVAALEPHKFWSLDLRLLENARSYGIYGDILDELCMQFHRPGISVVTHVIIETKAFQGGLLQDDRIVAARRRWNFDIMPFDTGVNKYDPDLGIPQIGPLMDYGEIDFPNRDTVSEDRYAPLYRQLRRWKPLVRGNKLEQDHVITFWFCVHWWKMWRRTLSANVDSRAFDFAR
ncbi:hypothetical protein, partial [Pseudomonas sp.]|uniref:hypothetical protein n=1 Tax=Pseudomonas sp. TaxID=306 RepID=UPI0026025237